MLAGLQAILVAGSHSAILQLGDFSAETQGGLGADRRACAIFFVVMPFYSVYLILMAVCIARHCVATKGGMKQM